MFRFRVAIVGHSQVPTEIEHLPSAVELSIFRAPGAKAKSFFANERLMTVFNRRYDLVILWLGSNDIEPQCRPRTIIEDLKRIVDQLLTTCTPKVKICQIEPRITHTRWRTTVEQQTYNRIAKAVNRRMYDGLLRDQEFISFGARPFRYNLRADGVHFNRAGQERVKSKLRGAICHSHAFQPETHWGYSDQAPYGDRNARY